MLLNLTETKEGGDDVDILSLNLYFLDILIFLNVDILLGAGVNFITEGSG